MLISDWSSDVCSSDLFLHGKTIKFLLSGGAYVPANGDGSTLVKSALEQYTYTSPDGAVYYFQRVHADNQKMIGAMHIRAYLMTVTRPDGRKQNGRWTCRGSVRQSV